MLLVYFSVFQSTKKQILSVLGKTEIVRQLIGEFEPYHHHPSNGIKSSVFKPRRQFTISVEIKHISCLCGFTMKNNIICTFGLLCLCVVLGSCQRTNEITKGSTTEGPTLNDILNEAGVLYKDNERHVAQVSNMLVMICTTLCGSNLIFSNEQCSSVAPFVDSTDQK